MTLADSPDPPGMRPVALVTGGAKRIGQAICTALVETHDVVIHANTSRQEAETLAATLRTGNNQAWVVTADLLDPAAVEGLVDLARKACGRPISVLINNASRFPERTLAEATWPDLEEMVRLHAWAPLALTRSLADQTDLVGDASVVNLLDTRIASQDPLHLPYILSKQMLAEVTRTTAALLAPRVRVNGVAPGPILAPSSKSGDAADQELQRGANAVPLGRAGTVEEVAQAALSLVHNPYITGQILFVDGGRHLRG